MPAGVCRCNVALQPSAVRSNVSARVHQCLSLEPQPGVTSDRKQSTQVITSSLVCMGYLYGHLQEVFMHTQVLGFSGDVEGPFLYTQDSGFTGSRVQVTELTRDASR